MKKCIILFLISLAAFSQAQSLVTGLQACYPFNGNANNYASTGPLLNGITSNVVQAAGHTNAVNSAYSLNGTTYSYIELPDHPGLKSDSVFFSGWFYIDSLAYEQYLVYSKNTCSYNFEAYSLIVYFESSVNHHVFRVSKSDSTCTYAPQIDSQTTPVLNTWYHVCFYVDNSVAKLYINGLLEGSVSHTTQFDYQSGKSVFLGVTNENNFNLPFKGRIDDVRFYSRELTAAEVLQLYTNAPVCTAAELTGIPNNTGAPGKIKLYPNPGNTGVLRVENAGNSSIGLFDVTGKKVDFIQSQVNETTVQLNLGSVANGIYFVRFLDLENNVTRTIKLVLMQQ